MPLRRSVTRACATEGRHYFAALLLASFLASLGIIIPHAWISAPCGLALLFYLLRGREVGKLRAMWSGLFFGTITGGAGTIWFWDTLPLDFLGIHDPFVQRVSIGMTWMYIAISLGLPIALVAPAIQAIRNLAIYPIAVGLLWAVAEAGRMWAFALSTWSPESLLGAHFSVASIGYPMTEVWLLRQLAYPFGIHGLNFFTAYGVAMVLALAHRWASGMRIRGLAWQVATVAILYLLPRYAITPSSAGAPTPPLRFALLSTNHMDVRDLPSHSILKDQLAAIAQIEPPVDVIALPEEFSLTSIFWSREEANAFITEHFGSRDVLILNTRNDKFPADETNASPEPKKLVYDSTRSGELGRYTKRNLMPLGEYSPAFTRTFFSLINDPDLQLYIDEVHELSVPAGERSMPAVSFKGRKIGALLCSDLLSPSLYNTLARREGAEVLVNLANQFWFHNSRLLYWKTLQMARVHAVQNRIPFVLVNNAAPSFVLDSRGSTLVESQWGRSTYLAFHL